MGETGRFDGAVVLVSGGARGQGAAEASLLVAQGARVVIGDVRADEGAALAASLGPAAAFVRLDVTSPADWDGAVAAATAMGPLRGLVNNAGIYQPAALLDTDNALWDRHLAINQTGCFLGLKAVVPAMAGAGGGSIVNVSSTAGLRGSPFAFAYCATKWALRGMTRAAALDFADRGIRVNSVHPGPIETGMLDVWPAALRASRLAAVPMKRTGTAEEVAELVLFLLSGASTYITGAEIAIDGGLCA